MAMETILADLGQNVVTARSGKEALRCCLDQDFAVILLDVNMPGLDGFETAYLIRQRKSLEHTPIIFVTGISDTETHVSRGYSLGAVDYILTPVLPEVLRTKVSVFVELFKKNQQLKRQARTLRQAHDELEVARPGTHLPTGRGQRGAQAGNRRAPSRRGGHPQNQRRIGSSGYWSARPNWRRPTRNWRHLPIPSRTICRPRCATSKATLNCWRRNGAEIAAEKPKQFLTRIDSRAKHMAQLISGLLNLSMIGKQGLEAPAGRTQSILLTKWSAASKSEMPDRRIEWKIQELPAGACDPNLMKQVFANLLSNAVKYTKPRADGGHRSGPDAGSMAKRRSFIRDNGVGFDMKYADKLFGVFQRLHPVAEFEGTGIGLATVDRIIRKHGGRVWAEAEEKKGATFYFTIGNSKAAAE